MESAEALKLLAIQLSKLVEVLNKQIEQHNQPNDPADQQIIRPDDPPANQRPTQPANRSVEQQAA